MRQTSHEILIETVFDMVKKKFASETSTNFLIKKSHDFSRILEIML